MFESSSAVFFSVLLTSLLGSPHCAAMCGGFTTIAAGSSHRPALVRIGAYHLGRLMTYLGVGVGASALTLAVPPAAFGAVLIVMGLLLLFDIRFVPASLHRSMTMGYRKLLSRFKPASAWFPLTVGLGSTLLPCGWLYVYVGMAASSQHPVTTMLAFWVGTLPMLTVWSAASSLILAKAGRFVPSLRALLLVLAGAFSVLQHTPRPVDASGHAPACHHAE